MRYLSNTTSAQCLLAAVLLASGCSVTAQSVTVYQTNADQSLLLAQQPSVGFGSSTSGATTITVDPGIRYQQMDGFGGALTDSSNYLIYDKLTAAQQSSVLQSLFSTTNGIGLSFLRLPMGATDFSAQGDFSYDDMPSGETDPNLTDFSLSKDMTYTIPVVKEALQVNPNLMIYMLPWSPPGWMKTSGTMNGGDFNTAYYSSLANYFVKTIQGYEAQGITIYAIAPQNEPENSTDGYPSESFSSSEESTFIANYLGPALASANLTTKIFDYEHNLTDITYPETVLQGAAYPWVIGTTWHCYNGGEATTASQLQAQYPEKGNWFTECTTTAAGVFSSDLAWAMENQIIGGPRNYAQAVLEWNLVLDQNYGPQNGGCTNCTPMITVNDSSSPATISYDEAYYFFGQASKFVNPGAYMIESNSAAPGTGGIEDVAFQNPSGSVALIVFNDASSSAAFNVDWAPNNEAFTYTLPAGSVATFSWVPSAGSLPEAPENLVATASASGSQIDLTWSSSSAPGATYNVYRSTSSSFTPSFSNLVAGSLSGTSYSDTGLAPGTTYYYVVNAADVNGYSSNSNQASATTGNTTIMSASSDYVIINEASGNCVDDDGSTSNGTVLQQWQCMPGNENQEWWLWSQNDQYYVIGNYNTNVTVWTVANAGTTPGTAVIQGSWGYGNNQEWQPVLLATGYYQFVDRNSGRCLDVPGGSNSNDLQLEIDTCNGSASQSFTLGALSNSVASGAWYEVINQTSGMCMSDTGSGTGNGTALDQVTCGSVPDQGWQFEPTNNGYYAAYNENATSLVWDDTNGSTTNGNKIQLWSWADNTNQQWLPQLQTNGLWTFTNLTSGSCLDNAGSTTSGTQMTQWSCQSGNSNQQYELVRIQ